MNQFIFFLSTIFDTFLMKLIIRISYHMFAEENDRSPIID
jgi:hypothetical protein